MWYFADMVCSLFCVLLKTAYVIFFFKQKTAYEMRISDWSSDVCSSDLTVGSRRALERRAIGAVAAIADGIEVELAEEAAAEQVEAVGDIPVEIARHRLELVGQARRTVAEFGKFERRRIVDSRAEAKERRFHVRIVVMIAGRVGVVEGQRRFDRNIGLRLRKAAEQAELESNDQRSEEHTSELQSLMR